VPPGGGGIVKKLLNIFAALPNCQSTGGVSIEMAKPILNMFILIGPHVRHFSDENQTVCPTLKNKSWPPIMPKQRERCLDL
jgi:hypothetical protein